jgi:hypothetical protein
MVGTICVDIYWSGPNVRPSLLLVGFIFERGGHDTFVALVDTLPTARAPRHELRRVGLARPLRLTRFIRLCIILPSGHYSRGR